MDADWVGNTTDKKSTSTYEYFTFIEGNLVT